MKVDKITIVKSNLISVRYIDDNGAFHREIIRPGENSSHADAVDFNLIIKAIERLHTEEVIAAYRKHIAISGEAPKKKKFWGLF